MPVLNTIQQWLELRCIPGRIEEHYTIVSYQVHAIGWEWLAVNCLISSVNIKVACQLCYQQRSLLR